MWTCDHACAVDLRQTTCAENKAYWGCEEPALSSEPSASVSADEARKADDASQVCSEKNLAAEQSATVGS